MEEHNANAFAERERARADRESYRNPWTVTRQAAASPAWRLTLGGDEPVTGVGVVQIDADEPLTLTIPETRSVRPGQAFRIQWWQSLASPAQFTVELHWARPNGEAHHTVMTLD